MKGFVAFAAVLGMCLPVAARGQDKQPAAPAPLAGAWTLNKDLSDQPMDRSERGDRGGDRGDSGGSRGGGFGGRRGGRFGGGGGYGGGGGRAGGMDRESMARMRDAMRELTMSPDHLVITQTASMIVITAPDGATTRLSPDGKKVKDENTKIERKTRWDGDKLVTEISGLPSKVTESYTLDSEHHQLRRVVIMEGRGQPRTITHVYDADAK